MNKAWDYHNQSTGKDEWLTPPAIIEALGPFDLDPCAAEKQPWATANRHYTSDGLTQPWAGLVWCNPPYDAATPWLERCAEHNNAIALLFARTETRPWFNHIWPKAKAILFVKGRLTFFEFTCQTCGVAQSQHDKQSPDCGYIKSGTAVKGTSNSGGPSALIAYGDIARVRLLGSWPRIPGALVPLR